ncbi:hypothetical protein ACLBKU_05360 [Erythrobacter sp. NE805]|uniref:hypothetical protein n=1 Tax=Erythrobacter sp. NE805 TaxID=3389875 RepID=UPI00396B2F76
MARRLAIGCLGIVLLILAGGIGYDYLSRYLSWANLSKEELVASARWYVRERAPGQKVCLYAVTCERGRARLALVKDLRTWDLEAARQLTWDRRFGDACPGQTANFALAVAPGGPELDPADGTDRAVWSFYLDRFAPYRTHSFAAFSEREPEACTRAHVVTP